MTTHPLDAALANRETLDPLEQWARAEQEGAILLRLMACAATATMLLAAALSLAT